ncbi:GGDEF domain-containing protein [Photobacterium sp. 1_MG-2023]|uniref:GGDEF domain-containing protein n=1 Tax=Photobacterium sp. 1_MG-2023 TaxID=3062646 RepID=UPI0026E1CCDA|nr:GGDEF domain-containing protein [Photobacterium sp. 1_MG-2023]MDO6708202.1 GGDEF domain-containing protein [Photobacterium sp. 1_MG-2023]
MKLLAFNLGSVIDEAGSLSALAASWTEIFSLHVSLPLFWLVLALLVLASLLLAVVSLVWKRSYRRAKIHRELARANQRMSLATSVAGIGVWEWDVSRDSLQWSPYLYDLYGIRVGSRLGLNDWIMRLKTGDGEKILRLKQLAGKNKQQTLIIDMIDPIDGQPRVLELVVQGLVNDGSRLIGTQRDISDVIERQRKMEQAALLDKLTGLPNTRALNRVLKAAFAAPDVENKVFGLMFIDLDGFKQVNDMLGHDVGDALLLHASRRMRGCLRVEDEVFRIGGDEFVVWVPLGEYAVKIHKPDKDPLFDDEDSERREPMILPWGDNDEELTYRMETIAEKLLHTLTEPFNFGENQCRVSASIGIARYPFHASDAQKLLKLADSAMYQAKRKGKRQFAHYDPTVDRMGEQSQTHPSIGPSDTKRAVGLE